MTYDELKELELKLLSVKRENRERIDEMFGHATVRGMRDCPESKWHDMWMDWQDELWHRLNWAAYMDFYLGAIRKEANEASVRESDIAWTLQDYVYSS